MSAPAPDQSAPTRQGGPPLRTWLAVAAGGLLVLTALAATTPVLAPLREGQPRRWAMLVGVGLVVGLGAIVALLVVTVVHLVLFRGRSWLSTLLRALPLIAVGLALLALFAISRTAFDPVPPRPHVEPSRSSEADGTEPGSGTDGGYGRATARIGDHDGDGRADIGIDTDGDGDVDHIARPRSDSGSDSGGGGELELDDGEGSVRVETGSDGELVAEIDHDGDGDIDDRISLDADGDGKLDVDTDSGIDLDDLRQLFGDLDLPELDDDPDAPADDPDDEPAEDDPAEDAAGADDPPASAGNDSSPTSVLWPVLGALLLIALLVPIVGALGALLARRRATPGPAPDPDQTEDDEAAREAMAETMAGSIDAMLADPDPRTAIIGAYARLLEGLQLCGVGRLAHEAPLEHMRRVLTGLRVRPEPLRRLIELFEVARFSQHPLTEAHRTEALECLRVAAADLTAAAPPPAPPDPVGAAS